MADGKSLKEKNAWLIHTALVLHALAFVWAATDPGAILGRDALSVERIQSALAPGALSLGIIAIAGLVLLGLVPPGLRDKLIHWRWRDPLPGCRAFSEIGPGDSRVEMALLRGSFGPLPSLPAEQNRLFYSIYRAHQNESGVCDAHRSYLAARDISVMNLILFVALPPVAVWATGDPARALKYAGALLAAYGLTCIAAQVYAKRFVQNVLAAASH